jgi:hypothetical protein
MTTDPDVRDRGEYTVQSIWLFPIAALLCFMCVQMATYFHAANVASSSAAQGAASAARRNGGVAAAQATVAQVIAENGATLSSTAATVGAAAVSVEVTVSVNRIVPFFPTTVRRTATEPRERFVAEGSR